MLRQRDKTARERRQALQIQFALVLLRTLIRRTAFAIRRCDPVGTIGITCNPQAAVLAGQRSVLPRDLLRVERRLARAIRSAAEKTVSLPVSRRPTRCKNSCSSMMS